MEGFNVLMWPRLKSTDFRIIDRETSVVGCVEKGNATHGTILAKGKKVRTGFAGIVSDEGNVELVLMVDFLFLHVNL